MGRLRQTPEVDPQALWAAGLWRAAFSAVALCVVVVSVELVIAGPAVAEESESGADAPGLEEVLLSLLDPFSD